MLGRCRADPHTTDLDFVADTELVHIGEASQQPPRAARDDDCHFSPEEAKRGAVEVVVVNVRHQYDIDICQLGHVERGMTLQVGNTRAENRVREEADAVQLDQKTGVPDVDETR